MVRSYELLITKKAAKQILAMPPMIRSRVLACVEQLPSEPRPNGVKKLSGSDAYRARVGDYRIIYTVDDTVLTIRVVKAGHRRNIYEKER